jgi:hypothetical protein
MMSHGLVRRLFEEEAQVGVSNRRGPLVAVPTWNRGFRLLELGPSCMPGEMFIQGF